MATSDPPEHPSTSPTPCEKEPIRFPGTVQPHGVLMVLDAGLNILRISDSSSRHLGRDAQSLLHTPFLELFPAIDRQAIQDSIRCTGPEGANPFPVRLEVGGESRFFDGSARVGPDGSILVELESNPRLGVFPAIGLDHHLDMIGRSIALTSGFNDTTAFARVMAHEIKALTGYDRVMIYQFLPGFHGHVIAEALEEGMEPFLGLHYPASDIPAQARELYQTKRVRAVCDVNAVPSPVIPASGPEDACPLDLSHSTLRSLSPIHIQYLKNMGVQSSLSVSLVVDDELWGLILCHHRTPRFLPYALRSTARLYGTVMAALMEAKRNNLSKERIAAAQGRALALLTGSREVAGLEGDLFTMVPKLMEFFGATGGILFSHTRILSTGATPDETAAGLLRDELQRQKASAVIVTGHAAADFPSLSSSAATASGLVAIHLGMEWLVLLRGEVTRLVAWAGDPREPKHIDATGNHAPRKNFGRWLEEVRGESEPWPEETETLAIEIRAGLLEIIQRKNAALARTNDDLRRFAGTVAHEVKNHLQTGTMALDLVQELSSAQLPPELRQIVSLGRERLSNLGSFVDELLAFSKTDISSDMTLIDLHGVATAIVRELEDARLTANARIHVAPLPQVWGHETQLRHVVANLVRNALVHAGDGLQTLNIEIGFRTDHGTGVVYVKDDGRGIPPHQREKIFEYFFRGAVESGGSGIGLAFCHQALDRMGQKIWVEDAPPRGSAFCFTVRTAPDVRG
jgi:chemotaxis family two-component system sensor kinase Cph1